MLKVIEAQTFVCNDATGLSHMVCELQKLSEEFRLSLPTDYSGLVIPEGMLKQIHVW